MDALHVSLPVSVLSGGRTGAHPVRIKITLERKVSSVVSLMTLRLKVTSKAEVTVRPHKYPINVTFAFPSVVKCQIKLI